MYLARDSSGSWKSQLLGPKAAVREQEKHFFVLGNYGCLEVFREFLIMGSFFFQCDPPLGGEFA